MVPALDAPDVHRLPAQACAAVHRPSAGGRGGQRRTGLALPRASAVPYALHRSEEHGPPHSAGARVRRALPATPVPAVVVDDGPARALRAALRIRARGAVAMARREPRAVRFSTGGEASGPAATVGGGGGSDRRRGVGIAGLGHARLADDDHWRATG